MAQTPLPLKMIKHPERTPYPPSQNVCLNLLVNGSRCRVSPFVPSLFFFCFFTLFLFFLSSVFHVSVFSLFPVLFFFPIFSLFPFRSFWTPSARHAKTYARNGDVNCADSGAADPQIARNGRS